VRFEVKFSFFLLTFLVKCLYNVKIKNINLKKGGFMRLLLVFIIVGLFSSCEESVEFPTTHYQLQEVQRGAHYCSNKEVYSFKGDIFVCYVRLDTSLFVHHEGAYQNKLVGFMEGRETSSAVHENSARVSYHTISHPTDSLKDTLVFKTYVYNNGTRLLDQGYILFKKSYRDVRLGLGSDSVRILIKLANNYYVFQVDDHPEVSVTRTSTLPSDSIKTVLTHYYGGTPVAPHNMRLWVKYRMEGTGKSYSGYSL
jgi:hypothetical protein